MITEELKVGQEVFYKYEGIFNSVIKAIKDGIVTYKCYGQKSLEHKDGLYRESIEDFKRDYTLKQ